MIRAHQPGSEPIDIPETIPNPVVVPKPTPTPTKPAPKEPIRAPRGLTCRGQRRRGPRQRGSTNSSRCRMAQPFEPRLRARTRPIEGPICIYRLGRICMELPGTSVQRFKGPRCSFYGLRSGFSPSMSIRCCKHLNGSPSELSRFLKKLTWYVDITRVLYNALQLP
jgi:hypothetical protein